MRRGDREGFVHAGSVVAEVLKEISGRAELLPRLEAERGRPLTDAEFLTIAEATGLKI